MVTWLAVAAAAAPVMCDPVEAQALLAEARIDEARAAETHPWLTPGLARAATDTDPDLRRALDEVCTGTGQTLQPGPAWRDATWSAHTLFLSRTEVRGCTLYEQTLAITVGRRDGHPPRYALQDRLPWSRTPIDDCGVAPAWREETVLAGADGPVRAVLAVDREGDAIRHSEIRLRRATPAGWHDVRVHEPAPDRLIGGFDGPTWTVAPFEDDWIAVETGGRVGSADACTALHGQRVWTWDAGWTRHDGDDARALLARAGLWRLAGDDGWLLVLAYDEASRADTLAARRRRLERILGRELLVLPSGAFPGLTPGFLVAGPPPYATRDDALAAKASLRRRFRAYVKQAWAAVDPCSTR